MPEEIVSTTPLLYSTAQMDNFYAALARGIVKPTGIMNYLQHLFIAERCPAGASVLDVCCGRGLQVPLLTRYAPTIDQYVGVDISQANLDEAQEVIWYADGHLPPFPCEFIRGDACFLASFLHRHFDVVIYTSALEHLEREAGAASLEQVTRLLADGGTLYLSTPRTEGPPPRTLQHRVHIYEWGKAEVEGVLKQCHLTITACYGLLPPADALLADAIVARFGDGAGAWFQQMQQGVPHAFLAPIVATAFPEVATELLYVCQKA
ncbi:MAG: class I SAM-dependent methyltransferase [Ktedonobacteraceae bacterium]